MINGDRHLLTFRSNDHSWVANLHLGDDVVINGEFIPVSSPLAAAIRARAQSETFGVSQPIVDHSFLGKERFTPEYIEKIGDPIYKQQRDTENSTEFGWMFPCVVQAADYTVRQMPQQERFRVMDWGPGSDYQRGGASTEPFEIVGAFRAKGKQATVESFDINPNGFHFTNISTSWPERLRYLARALGIEVEENRWSANLPLERYVGHVEDSVSFFQQDALDIDRMETEPYDLIMMLNLFPCISDRHPETKDNILYHALRLLRPRGLLMFNDCCDYEIKDWIAHFALRLKDLPVRRFWDYYYGKRWNEVVYCVEK
ncbi:hypothetical protein HZC35_00840 [Candidatus Saganbacteria bacterium]|nr:hypothetical protein [Candidatus Saganbacteria bacterium]